MKILLSVPAFYPFSHGGGQSYVLHVGRELVSRGHRVLIVSDSPWQGGAGEYCIRKYEYLGLDVISVQINPSSIHLFDLYSQTSGALMLGLSSVLDEEQPDLIHLNGFKTALTLLCHKKGIPFVMTAHHPGIVCPAGTLLTDRYELCKQPTEDRRCISCCVRRKLKFTWLAGILAVLPGIVSKKLGLWVGKRRIAPYIVRGLAFPWYIRLSLQSIRVALEKAPVIIAPSRAMAHYLEMNGTPPARVVVIPHGIVPLERQPTEPFTQRPVRFGYMGGCSDPKGFSVLMEALNRISPGYECELHIFGGIRGSASEQYTKGTMKRYRGNSRVFFHPLVPQEQLVEAYKSFDVLVVPSIYLEVFGLVVLEAQSTGRPVIASHCGGPEELIRDGKDGILVARNDPEALAEALMRCIQQPEVILRMADSLQAVRTMKEHVDDLLTLYKKVRAL